MNSHFMNRAFFGLLLIGIGVVFLLHQMNVITMDISHLLATYWPVILICFGLKGMAERLAHRYGSLFWNAMLILIGLFFLGRNLGFLELSAADFFKSLLPVALIIFGLTMLFRPHRKSHTDWSHMGRAHEHEERPSYGRWNWQDNWNRPAQVEPVPMAEPAANPAEEPHVEYSYDRQERERQRAERRRERDRQHRERHGEFGGAHGVRNYSGFFNDLYLGHDYWELEPMNISHFIGDTVIDLTKAQIPTGETEISVSAFIGDVKVFIPNDMDVAVNVVSSTFIGDLTLFDRHDSGFMRSHHAESPYYAESEKRVRFQVSMFIGDIKVQKVG